MLCCPSLVQEKARTFFSFFFSYRPKQKRLASWSIDWLDRSTKGLIEVWDQPKTKAEQLAAARLDVYLSHHAPYSYKGRWKECSAHLSYGSLPQRSFAPSAFSIQKGSVFFLVNSVLKQRHYWTKEMPGRSIALGRRCRTCLNRKCIRYSIPSSIPQNFDSKVCISSLLLSDKGGWQTVYFRLYVAVSSMSVDW